MLAFDNEKTIMSEKRGVGCFSKEIYTPEFCYFKYEVYKKKILNIYLTASGSALGRSILFITGIISEQKMKSQFYKIKVLKNSGLFH